MSRVVISFHQELSSATIAAVLMLLKHFLGGKQRLSIFDAKHFRDFIWRGLFSKSLDVKDFALITSCRFRIASVPWTAMHRVGLQTKRLGHAIYPRLDTTGFDVLIAETPFPATVSAETSLVVRYHDAVPILMPHTIADRHSHEASHYNALRRNVLDGAHFACVSESTRKDLISIFPEVESRAVTIHNMISHHYFPESCTAIRAAEIVRSRRHSAAELTHRKKELVGMQPASSGATTFEFLLMVSTIEPRKNHVTLLEAWEKLRFQQFPNLKLVLVGPLGWEHQQIMKRLLPCLETGLLHLLEDVPSSELRLLYNAAACTVCPSLAEGFDFSGVESMRCGGIVVASDLPVHREIYGDAALYFNPYSADELCDALASVLSERETGAHAARIAKGAFVSAAYLPEVIKPKWKHFLTMLPSSSSV